MSRTRTIWLWRPFIICVLLCALYGLAIVVVRGNSYTFVTLGERYAPNELASYVYSEEGYDGQFTYYLARYGLAAEPYLDAPAYRAQRILLSVIASITAQIFNNNLPVLLFLINLIALGAGTALLENLLKRYNISQWYALGYGLSLGVFGSARLITTETLSYAFILGGIVLLSKDKWLWGALCFGLAAITKETTLFFPAAYAISFLFYGQWRRVLLFSTIAIGPFVMWQIVLWAVYGEFGIGSGGALATPFEIIPFMGFFRILLEGNPTIFIVYSLVLGPFVVLPVLWALWRGWQDMSNKRWTTELSLLVIHASILLFVPFSTYRELLGIFRFTVGLQIALLLYAAKTRRYRILQYSTLFAFTSLFVIASDFSLSS